MCYNNNNDKKGVTTRWGDKKQKLALKISKTIKKYLDSKKWRYNVSSDPMSFSFSLNTGRLPFQYQINIAPDSEIVCLTVGQNLVVPEDRRVTVAYALNTVNDTMVDGVFDYDVTEGTVCFRLIVAYGDAEFGSVSVEYMINVAYSTLDKFNGTIVDYAEDQIDRGQFFKKCCKEDEDCAVQYNEYADGDSVACKYFVDARGAGKDFFRTFRMRASATVHKYATKFQKLQKGEIKIDDMAK